MNTLPVTKKVAILKALIEGNSMRSTSRLVDVHVDTVTKLLVAAGKVCAEYHDTHVRNITAKHVQCDEIWSFCYAKKKTVQAGLKAMPEGGAGDVWAWTAIDSDSKLIID